MTETQTQDINPGEHAIDKCQWCRGSGKDGATMGMPVVRDCPRCLGSGKVYVTSKESVTGRRRVFKGPVPKLVQAAQEQRQLNETLKKPETKHKGRDRAA